jgi:PBSX family phage terminase large subunit
MALLNWQKTVVEDNARFRVILAGRRSGKTYLSIEELIFNSVSIKNSRVCYVAPTYQSARDIAWDLLKNRLKDYKTKINDSRLEIEVGTGKIMLRSWENIDTLRGQYFDFIILDEVAQYKNFWLNWQEVLRPTLADKQGRVLFISTPLGFNHFYDLYNIKNPDYKSFHFTSYDNPHLPKEELEKAKEEMTEDRFAQEFLADFRKTEGLVYKEFDRHISVTADRPKTVREVLVGIDWGYTNPASVHKYEIDADNGVWISNEFYKTKRTSEQIIDYAKSLKPNKVYPDPAEPDRIDMANAAGLNCMHVSKDIEAGIDSVRQLFKQNRIHIHPSCENLILELETYHYPPKRPNQNENELPVDEFNHSVDEARYVIHNYFKNNNKSAEEQIRDFQKQLPKENLFDKRGFYI